MKTTSFSQRLLQGLLILCLTGMINTLSAQNDLTSPLSEFLILVETHDKGVTLTSKQGCAFGELSFSLNEYKPQAVNQYGMTSSKENDTTVREGLANFLFTITRTKDGLRFEGLEGTAWTNLSFSCPNNKCHQLINQYGMIEE